MPCVRWGNIQVKKLARMQSCNQTCLITCTWSFSGPRGTSTSLASLSSSGCESSVSYTDTVMTRKEIIHENQLIAGLDRFLTWGISPAPLLIVVFAGLWSEWSHWLTNWQQCQVLQLLFRHKLTAQTRLPRNTSRTMSCWNRLGHATVVTTTTAKSMRQYTWQENSPRLNHKILKWFKVYIVVVDSRCLLLVCRDYMCIPPLKALTICYTSVWDTCLTNPHTHTSRSEHFTLDGLCISHTWSWCHLMFFRLWWTVRVTRLQRRAWSCWGRIWRN